MASLVRTTGRVTGRLTCVGGCLFVDASWACWCPLAVAVYPLVGAAPLPLGRVFQYWWRILCVRSQRKSISPLPRRHWKRDWAMAE